MYEEAFAREGLDERSAMYGKALYALGQHNYVRGRLADAIGPTERALSIAREQGDEELIVLCLDRIGLACVWLGDTTRAQECCDEELIVANRAGNRRLVGFALTAKGGVARALGHYDAAADAYEEALALFDDAKDPNNRHNALVNVARVNIARGELGRAQGALGDAIRLVGETGATYRGHSALEAAARLAAARCEWSRAARLQGTSDAAVDRMGGSRIWFDDAVLAALATRPAEKLGEAAHATAYQQGRVLTLDAALDEVIAWFAEPAARLGA